MQHYCDRQFYYGQVIAELANPVYERRFNDSLTISKRKLAAKNTVEEHARLQLLMMDEHTEMLV